MPHFTFDEPPGRAHRLYYRQQGRGPLLLILAGNTALPQVARQSCQMAEQIPNCRLYLHNEGGHPLMWSQPEAFRAAADRFLKAVE